jgi:dihydrodipicolinate synthase/N-acetylneuraminate lyase
MELDAAVADRFTQGAVIPAHPLALTAERTLDERRQRALTRYYLDAGAGGLAVGVHTTQFEVRDPEVGLFEPVLQIASEEAAARGDPSIVLIAGLVGPTEQATREAEIATRFGYHLGLLSPGGLGSWTEEALLDRARAVSRVIPLMGFYLQPAVGGRVLSYEFWRRFFDLPGIHGCKVACFDRYATLDVMRAACDSDRRNSLALYTGNDDNIVADLLTPFPRPNGGAPRYFAGGLLGQWAVWTRRAVELLDAVRLARESGCGYDELLAIGAELTDANAAIFDRSNGFRGCIPGIHEVLRRQGLLEGTWCIRSDERLSAGQSEEITRICRERARLTDDEFVAANLDRWLT